MKNLRKFDMFCINKLQKLYDYTLDYYGMLLGTFKLLLALSGAIPNLIWNFAIYGINLMNILCGSIIVILVLVLAYKFLEKENTLQKQGKFVEINNKAIKNRSMFKQRMSVLIIQSIILAIIVQNILNIVFVYYIIISAMVLAQSECILVKNRVNKSKKTVLKTVFQS